MENKNRWSSSWFGGEFSLMTAEMRGGRFRGLGTFLAEVRDVTIPGDVEVNSGWPPTVWRNKYRNEYTRRALYGATRTCVSHARAAANDGNVSVCLKDRCEQVYERRQQTSKGPDKRRNRESTWLTAVTALDTPEAFPAAAYGLGLRIPAKSQLLSARYGEQRICSRL